MYGLGLPLLWPIAAGSFFALYFVEKTMIYYSYIQPPMYDEKLNNHVLGHLTWAPLFLLAFGYWMLSNHQFWNYDLFSLVYSNDI